MKEEDIRRIIREEIQTMQARHHLAYVMVILFIFVMNIIQILK